jgi:hypothetical protein
LGPNPKFVFSFLVKIITKYPWRSIWALKPTQGTNSVHLVNTSKFSSPTPLMSKVEVSTHAQLYENERHFLVLRESMCVVSDLLCYLRSRWSF